MLIDVDLREMERAIARIDLETALFYILIIAMRKEMDFLTTIC